MNTRTLTLSHSGAIIGHATIARNGRTTEAFIAPAEGSFLAPAMAGGLTTGDAMRWAMARSLAPAGATPTHGGAAWLTLAAAHGIAVRTTPRGLFG